MHRYIKSIPSPAEKYDQILGQNILVAYTQKYMKDILADGQIPSYYGLCDGWSIAANVVPRPLKSVLVTTSDGQQVQLSPLEMKGLAAYTFSVSFSTNLQRMLRVYKFPTLNENLNKDQVRKIETEQVLDLINLVTQRLKSNKPLVMDKSRTEVWNYNIVQIAARYEASAKRSGKLKIQLKHIKNKSPDVNAFYENDSNEKDIFSTLLIEINIEKDANGEVIHAKIDPNTMPDFFWTVDDQLLELRNYFLGKSVAPSAIPNSVVDLTKLKELVQQSRE